VTAYQLRDANSGKLIAFYEAHDGESIVGKLVNVRRGWYRVVSVLPEKPDGLPAFVATAQAVRPVGGGQGRSGGRPGPPAAA